MTASSPIPHPGEIEVRHGPALLSGVGDGPSLASHRHQYGDLPTVGTADLIRLATEADLRGRGGAGFPFAVKLETTARRRRPVVVVNLAEGEPASAKDTALALTRPHLVLDGAVAAARALKAGEMHLVVPGERPQVEAALSAAVAERSERFVIHRADPVFVAGQARAVLELMAGRPNLPVTAWTPESVHGHRGRPTLLSNAETWAQLGRLVLTGSHADTTLLTLAGTVPTVVEVAVGSPLRAVLPEPWHGRPALVGGFHGTWLPWTTLAGAEVSRASLPLGAGVVISPAGCPLSFASRVVDYLADQSARRCGPCRGGLPALAAAVGAVDLGTGGTARVDELVALVTQRGACAHPDGTARMVSTLLVACSDEVARHAAGACSRRAEVA